ncbi:hypothetical protein C8Q72DRAFT_820436 [Fomitopsis betulina]|nr:hypothetical protein C8Q72DRAFT_820436 [Fomitopsis betulina]
MAQPSESLQRRRSMSDFLIMQAQRGRAGSDRMFNEIFSHLQNDLAHQQKLQELSEGLPRLTEQDLAAAGEMDSPCPICLTPFAAIIAEEEMALAMDTPAHPVEQLGVTRFKDTCRHIFCRKDALSWMRQGRITCPTCRRPFIELPNDTPLADGQQPPPTTANPLEHLVNSADILRGAMENLRDMGLDPEAFFLQAIQGARTQEDDRETEFSGMYS